MGKRECLLFSWLHENVHRHGKKYTPDELVTRRQGNWLTHEPFVAYVTKKFSRIYGLLHPRHRVMHIKAITTS